MDVSRRLSLTAGITAIAVAAYNPVALALVNRADPATTRLGGPLIAALTVLTMLGGVWFIVRPRIEQRVGFLRRHATAGGGVVAFAMTAPPCRTGVTTQYVSPAANRALVSATNTVLGFISSCPHSLHARLLT